MKAVVLKALGPPSVLQLVGDHPKPVRRPGEVLVKMKSTSVNAIDNKIRAGKFPKFQIALPQILGGDVAGTVVEADENSKFKVGERVYGYSEGYAPGAKFGTYAEYVTMKDSQLAVIPPSLSWEEAAALPLTFLTAWQALEPAVPLSGKRVLIHAGAGAVGGFAIQIAKAQGAHVTTTCSGSNADFVRELGADEVLDYRKAPFDELWRKSGADMFDAVVDTIGGEYEIRSRPLTKPGKGWYIQIMTGNFNRPGGLIGWLFAQLWARVAAWFGGPQNSLVFATQDSSRGLQQAAELIESGKVKVHVDRVFPLSEAAAAHAYTESNGPRRGKVVLQID